MLVYKFMYGPYAGRPGWTLGDGLIWDRRIQVVTRSSIIIAVISELWKKEWNNIFIKKEKKMYDWINDQTNHMLKQ